MKNNRLQNKKGFTMAELLIVVAIIAVLVAVAIPVFNSKLERSKEAVDIHLMRTVASMAQEYYLSGVHDQTSANAVGMGWYGQGNRDGWNAYAVYDVTTGNFLPSYDSFYGTGKKKPYGKGTKKDGGMDWKNTVNDKEQWVYDPAIDYTDAVCQVSIFPNGNNKRIEVAWKRIKGSVGGGRPFVGNGETGKAGYKYGDKNYPRLTIPLD